MDGLAQIGRGLQTLCTLAGWPFVAAVLGLAALLLRALLTLNVGLASIGVLVLALLLIRAHDLGELPPARRVDPAPEPERLDFPSPAAKAAMALGTYREGHDL